MVVLFIVLAGAQAWAAQKVVIVYNSPPEWANWKQVQAEFTKLTDIFAPPDNRNSGQTLSQLIAEQNKPQADAAYFGITYGLEAAERGLLEPYQPKGWELIPAELKDPQGRWFTIHSGTVAFIVNKDALGKVPVPRSWKDLLQPQYKNMVAFLDPTSAFVGYAVCTAANIAMGGTLDNWDPGIQYLAKLEKNGVMHPKQTSYAKVVQGEIPIMIEYDFNGYRMKYSDKVNVEVVIPHEGSLIMPYVIGMVKGAPHKENAKRLLDFVLSDQGQAIWAEGYVRPIRPHAMTPATKTRFLPESEYARAKAVDYKKMTEVMDAFKQRWINEILK